MLKIIAKNTFYQVLAKIFTSGTVLLSTVLISRFLGSETFGDYSVVLAFTTSFFVLSDLGVSAFTVKEFSKDRDSIKKNFSSILLLKASLGFLLVLFVNILLVFMPYPQFIKSAIKLLSFLLFFQSLSGAVNIVFQSRLEYSKVALLSGLSSLLTLLLLIPPLLIFKDFNSLILFSLLGYGLYPLMSLIFLRRLLKVHRESLDIKYWRYVFLASLPLGIGLLLNSFMVQADRFLLSFMVSSISVGIYSLAYKVFDLVLVIPAFFMNASYPLLAKAKAEEEARYIKLAKKSLTVLVAISLVLLILSVLLSRGLFGLVWGVDLGVAYFPFNALMFAALLFFISSPLGFLLVIEGKQKFLPRIYGPVLLFNIVANVFFIPKFGYMASAVITGISELFVVIGLIFCLGKNFMVRFLRS